MSTTTTGSLIPSSENFDTEYNAFLQCSSIISKTTTDGYILFEKGMVSNLNGPFSDQTEAVNIGYIKPAQANSDLFTLQYNDVGIFNGTPSLSFVIDTLTVSGPSIKFDGSNNGLCIIENNVISNLDKPKFSTDIVTKIYVDNYSNERISYVTTSSGHNYSADQLINTNNVRKTDNDVTDTFPDAITITKKINELFNSVTPDSYYNFTIINDSNNTINITHSSNVTVVPSTFVILPTYTMYCTLIVNTQYYVTVNINNISFNKTYISNYFQQDSLMTQFPYKIDGLLIEPTLNTTVNTSLNYSYSVADLNSGLVVRSPPSVSSDTFATSGFLTTNGGQLIIQNTGFYSITIGTNNSWQFQPDQSLTISSSKTGIFWINCSAEPCILNTISIS
jgi:hypothetical protein